MKCFPVFLSVVVVVRNSASDISEELRAVTDSISGVVSDYELIIIDNASTDDTVAKLKMLTSTDGLPNLQVYALTKEVDTDTASWVGLENALGDFVVVYNHYTDDISFVPSMLEKAVSGADVVFAENLDKPIQSLSYSIANSLFNAIFRCFSGVDLTREAPQYRLLSKTVVNFILQHPLPPVTYRHLPASGGFEKHNLQYHSPISKGFPKKNFGDAFDKGMRLLVSTTKTPMRLVTFLSLFGAIGNLLYSVYVLVIGLFNSNVMPGWTSLSLQQSGMFMLISLVLLILGEYIMHTASLSSEGPLYHVGNEFNSQKITRLKKLNIEEYQEHPQ